MAAFTWDGGKANYVSGADHARARCTEISNGDVKGEMTFRIGGRNGFFVGKATGDLSDGKFFCDAILAYITKGDES